MCEGGYAGEGIFFILGMCIDIALVLNTYLSKEGPMLILGSELGS